MQQKNKMFLEIYPSTFLFSSRTNVCIYCDTALFSQVNDCEWTLYFSRDCVSCKTIAKPSSV